jgi:hypothetical protein
LLRVISECEHKQEHMHLLHKYFDEQEELVLAQKLLAEGEDSNE